MTGALWRGASLLFGVATTIAVLAGASRSIGGCATENTCTEICPTGSRFLNDGTCRCVPFDAGYCALASGCLDAACPASAVPDACGGGQLWSTTICGCYPLPDGAFPDPLTRDAHADP